MANAQECTGPDLNPTMMILGEGSGLVGTRYIRRWITVRPSLRFLLIGVACPYSRSSQNVPASSGSPVFIPLYTSSVNRQFAQVSRQEHTIYIWLVQLPAFPICIAAACMSMAQSASEDDKVKRLSRHMFPMLLHPPCGRKKCFRLWAGRSRQVGKKGRQIRLSHDIIAGPYRVTNYSV